MNIWDPMNDHTATISDRVAVSLTQSLLHNFSVRGIPTAALSLMMTGPRSRVEGDDDVLMLSDIARAHLQSPLARVVFVTISGECLQVAQSHVWTARCGSIIRPTGTRCNENDASFVGQIEQLCWVRKEVGELV